MWCIAQLDEEYVARMEDVLRAYERPYDAAQPVVCFDERPVSLHADLRPPQPARPGCIAKRDNEYQRCGMANVFCAVEPKAGRHFLWPTPNRSGPEFAQVLGQLILSYPRARTIHLILDNLNIHCRKSLTDLYGQRAGAAFWNCLTVHYTPKHGSWLNQAEIELSLFSRQCLGARRIPDLSTLRRQARLWNQRLNRARLKINWRFDRKAARRKFGYHKNLFMRS